MRRKHGRLVIVVSISVMGILSVFSLLNMSHMEWRSRMCYFNFRELASPDTNEVLVRPELVKHINSLVVNLQDLTTKASWLRINSGYRTKEHNKTVGGAKHSYHMRGMAVDTYSPQLCLGDLARLALQCGFTTAIVYKTHVHLDIREKGLGLRRKGGE